jgi:uncharacterized protein YlxW (UPF0749 family)
MHHLVKNSVQDPVITGAVRLEQTSLDEWRQRAFSLQVEVRDLLIEQQRLQYLVESLTNHLAVAHRETQEAQEGFRASNKKIKGSC